MNSLIQDLKYAVRVLLKSRGFTIVSLLTLAIGVSANTAMFSFVNAWILQPLPYGDPDRLVVVWSSDTKTGTLSSATGAEFTDWKSDTQVFEDVAAYNTPSFNITGDGIPDRVRGAQVSANFFNLLQMTPALGRTFAVGEDEPENNLVVVISDALWRTRFTADPGIIGRSMMIDQRAHTIIGVMPPTFHVPLLGAVQLWRPRVSLIAIGTVVGVAGGLITSKVLWTLLYRVHAFDLTIFVPAAALLAVAAILASYIPARRATRVDPMLALRYE